MTKLNSKLLSFTKEHRNIWQGHSDQTQAVVGILDAYNKEFGIKKNLELIMERLALLAPTYEDLNLHPGLRYLYNQYKMLKAFISAHKKR